MYRETFDAGPGGWHGWINNAQGPRALEIADSCAISRAPWWIDYNHAPPGAGYLHLLYILNTRGKAGEHQREVEGENQFRLRQFPTDLRDASMTLRLRGEMDLKGARMVLLCQAIREGLCSGWMLTSQPFRVATQWTEQTINLAADPSQWTCLGARHDRTEFYGPLPLETVLSDVNVNMLLVLHPLDIVPMGPAKVDPHLMRPEKDYPVWRSRLPDGYVMLDEVRIDFRD